MASWHLCVDNSSRRQISTNKGFVEVTVVNRVPSCFLVLYVFKMHSYAIGSPEWFRVFLSWFCFTTASILKKVVGSAVVEGVRKSLKSWRVFHLLGLLRYRFSFLLIKKIYSILTFTTQ